MRCAVPRTSSSLGQGGKVERENRDDSVSSFGYFGYLGTLGILCRFTCKQSRYARAFKCPGVANASRKSGKAEKWGQGTACQYVMCASAAAYPWAAGESGGRGGGGGEVAVVSGRWKSGKWEKGNGRAVKCPLCTFRLLFTSFHLWFSIRISIVARPFSPNSSVFLAFFVSQGTNIYTPTFVCLRL